MRTHRKHRPETSTQHSQCLRPRTDIRDGGQPADGAQYSAAPNRLSNYTDVQANPGAETRTPGPITNYVGGS